MWDHQGTSRSPFCPTNKEVIQIYSAAGSGLIQTAIYSSGEKMTSVIDMNLVTVNPPNLAVLEEQ